MARKDDEFSDDFKKFFRAFPKSNNEINRWIEGMWDKKYENNSYIPQPKPANEPRGTIIYTPHDCVLPNRHDHPIGTVFRCDAYYGKGEACHDLWELQQTQGGGGFGWVRVSPRWHKHRH